MKNQLQRINDFLDSVGIDAELTAQSGIVSISGRDGGIMPLDGQTNRGLKCVNKASCKNSSNNTCSNNADACDGSSNVNCESIGMNPGGGQVNQYLGC